MPRTFSDEEKQNVRNSLLEIGKESFSHYGLKKTNIEELTNAVGISKGAFYGFFKSKEILFFEILKQEGIHRDNILDKIIESKKSTKQSLKMTLEFGLDLIHDNLFLAEFYNEQTYAILKRKLPGNTLEAFMKTDDGLLLIFTKKLQQKPHGLKKKPLLASGIIRSFFLLCLHKKDVGEEVFSEVMRFYIDAIVNNLAKGK